MGKLDLENVQQLYMNGQTTLVYYQETFGVSKKTVQRAFRKLGLVYVSDFEMNLQKKLPQAIQMYIDGSSIIEVCTAFDIHVKVLRSRLKELGIYRNEQSRYSANYDFFEVIDTEEKAYWLGFIAADGCRWGKRSLKIGLNSEDIGHLEKIKESMDANYKISYESNWKENDHAVLIMTHPKLASDLEDKGIVPRKTHILEMPTRENVPYELLHHYIRGYFDGDGCITDNGNGQPAISFVGNLGFILPLQTTLVHECNINFTKLRVRKPESPNIKTFMYTGKGNARKLYNYMYKDATIFLDRKRDRFLSYL